jgi:hypothetical protein
VCAPEKTSITYPEIATDQACLICEILIVELLKKKVYLDGMNILSILLSLESEYYNLPSLVDRHPRQLTLSQERPLLITSVCPANSIRIIQFPSQKT